MSSIDAEILAVIYGLNSFKLYIINKQEILVRTDCEAIVKFHQKIEGKNSSKRRWLKFSRRYVNIQYIVRTYKGKR